MLGSGLSLTVLSGRAGQCLGSVILESGMLQVSGGYFLGLLLLVLLIMVCPAESRSWAGFVIPWFISRIFGFGRREYFLSVLL